MNYGDVIQRVNDISFIIDYLDVLLYNRPIPHREYDQIYMRARSMVEQVEFVREYLYGKTIAFLGDGDGMSILLALISKKIDLGIKEMAVFDFDERILNEYAKICSEQEITIPMHFKLYNIINPIDPSEKSKYDFFYINPPYGSKNEGLSCILWLIRCIELSTENAEGCVIVPNDRNIPWTIRCVTNIFQFLEESGFQRTRIINNIHHYHLDDNPSLLSSMIIVHRIISIKSKYDGKRIPLHLCKNLYGSIRPIPQYIYASKSNPLGVCDFNWEYGRVDYLES